MALDVKILSEDTGEIQIKENDEEDEEGTPLDVNMEGLEDGEKSGGSYSDADEDSESEPDDETDEDVLYDDYDDDKDEDTDADLEEDFVYIDKDDASDDI